MSKDKRKAIIGTVIVHVLLVFALFFFAFTTPLPLPTMEGVEVNLGYMDQGMGKKQPKVTKKVETPKPKPKPKPIPPKPKEQVKEDLITQDVEDAPVIEDVNEELKEEKKKPEPIVEKEKPIEQPVDTVQAVIPDPEPVEEVIPDPVADPRAMYGGSTTTTNTKDGSEGITGQPGDQGKPTGDTETDRYEGLGGKGNGISADLGKRKAKSLPPPTYGSKDQGKVVVTIWVNKYGEVIRVKSGARGTTVTDPKLLKYSEEAAKKAKFDSDPDAPETQKGTISYFFKIQG